MRVRARSCLHCGYARAPAAAPAHWPRCRNSRCSKLPAASASARSAAPRSAGYFRASTACWCSAAPAVPAPREPRVGANAPPAAHCCTHPETRARFRRTRYCRQPRTIFSGFSYETLRFEPSNSFAAQNCLLGGFFARRNFFRWNAQQEIGIWRNTRPDRTLAGSCHAGKLRAAIQQIQNNLKVKVRRPAAVFVQRPNSCKDLALRNRLTRRQVAAASRASNGRTT